MAKPWSNKQIHLEPDEFKLRITIGNDAMQTGEDVAGALRKVADKLQNVGKLPTFHHRNILDDNGNVVGTYAALDKDGNSTNDLPY